MRLSEYLDKSGLKLTAFGQIIGVSPEAVRRYRDGTRIPERLIMSRIFESTHGAVTANDFFGLPERPANADDFLDKQPEQRSPRSECGAE